MNDEQLVHEIRRAHERGGDLEAIATMLDHLIEALDADMEHSGGAHCEWMNDAAHSEFKRKYPRFVTLMNVARHVNWNEV